MNDADRMEQQITNLRKAVELKDLALKLEKVPEFQKLILDHFCVTECARFAQSSGDPSIPKEMREDALSMAHAAGALRRWLSMTVRMGWQAEEETKEVQDELVTMRQEGRE